MALTDRFWNWVKTHVRADTKQSSIAYRDGYGGGLPSPSNTVNELEFSWRHAYFSSCLNVIGTSAMGVPIKVMQLQAAPQSGYNGRASGPAQLRHAVKMSASMTSERYSDWLLTRGLEAEEADDNHPLRLLFDQPNKYLDTWPEFILKSLVQLVGTGDCFWELVGGADNNIPSELYTMQPDRVKIKPDPQTWVGGYTYKVGIKETKYLPEEVLHFKLPHPQDDLYGLSRADTLDPQLKLSWNAYKLNAKFFENGARPGGYLSPKGELMMNPGEFERLAEIFRARNVGINNMGKILMLNMPVDFIPDNTPPKDLEFAELIQQTEHEISGVTGVPRAMTGRTADVNRSNLDAMKVIFWTQTMKPLFSLMCSRINSSLCPRYGPGVFVEPDYSGVEVLQEEQSSASSRAVAEFNASIITRNEAREAVGEDTLDGPDGDVFKVGPQDSFKAAGDELLEEPAPEPIPPDIEPPDEPATRAAPEVTMPANFGSAEHIAAIAEFEADINPFELRLEAAIKKLVARLKRETLSKLNNARASSVTELRYADGSVLFNAQEVGDELWDMVKGYILETEEVGFKAAVIKALGEGAGLTFDTRNPRTQAHLRMKELLVKTIPQKWHEKLRAQLLEGNALGEPVAKVAARVETVYNTLDTMSARRIAQTEIVGGYNSGAVVGIIAAGFDKEWISTLDDRVRDSHSRMFGEIVRADMPFSNGLQYPGGEGPASEVINCRCAVVPAKRKE